MRVNTLARIFPETLRFRRFTAFDPLDQMRALRATQLHRPLLDLRDDIIDHIIIIGFSCFLAGVIHHAIAGRAACEADVGEHGFAGAVDDAADDGQGNGLTDMGEAVF